MRNTLSSNSFPVHQVLVLGSPVHALSVPVRVQMVSVSEAVVVLFRSSDFVKVSGSNRRRGVCTGMDGSCFPEGQGLGNKRSERGMGGRDPEETVGGGEVGLLRVVSQEVEVDNGAGRRCGGPRVDGRVAGRRRVAGERRRPGVPGLGGHWQGCSRGVCEARGRGGISTRGWGSDVWATFWTVYGVPFGVPW